MKRKRTIIATIAAGLCGLFVQEAAAQQLNLVARDPLTSETPGPGIAQKIKSNGGAYSERGWISHNPNSGRLTLELASPPGLEGRLEIDLTCNEKDWLSANTQLNNVKVHFLSMFSHSSGHFHCFSLVDLGVADWKDHAFWSLRSGSTGGGGLRYGSTWELQKSSRSAKNESDRPKNPSYQNYVAKCGPVPKPHDFQEVSPKGASIDWKKGSTYSFVVAWSKKRGELTIQVNGRLIQTIGWRHQIQPLRSVWLGKARVFSSLVGIHFSNLKVYGEGKPVPVEPAKIRQAAAGYMQTTARTLIMLPFLFRTPGASRMFLPSGVDVGGSGVQGTGIHIVVPEHGVAAGLPFRK